MSWFNFFKNLFSFAPPEKTPHPLDGPTRVKEAPYKIETPAPVSDPVVEAATPTAEPVVEAKPEPVVKKTRKSPVKRAVEKANAKDKVKKAADAAMAKKTRGRKPRAK